MVARLFMFFGYVLIIAAMLPPASFVAEWLHISFERALLLEFVVGLLGMGVLAVGANRREADIRAQRDQLLYPKK